MEDPSFKAIAVVLAVAFAFMLSGCLEQLDYSRAKELPEVRAFLESHPLAKLTVRKIGADFSENAGLIVEECAGIPKQEYIYVLAADNNAALHIWLDSRKWNNACIAETVFSKETKKKTQPKQTAPALAVIVSRQRASDEGILWAEVSGISISDANATYTAAIENSRAIFRGTGEQFNYIGEIRSPPNTYYSLEFSAAQTMKYAEGVQETVLGKISADLNISLIMKPSSTQTVVLDFNETMEGVFAVSVLVYDSGKPEIDANSKDKGSRTVTMKGKPVLVSINTVFFDLGGEMLSELHLGRKQIERAFSNARIADKKSLEIIDKNTVVISGISRNIEKTVVADINSLK